MYIRLYLWNDLCTTESFKIPAMKYRLISIFTGRYFYFKKIQFIYFFPSFQSSHWYSPLLFLLEFQAAGKWFWSSVPDSGCHSFSYILYNRFPGVFHLEYQESPSLTCLQEVPPLLLLSHSRKCMFFFQILQHKTPCQRFIVGQGVFVSPL